MANTATLPAQKREGTGKGVARKLRAAGRLPAVLYGRELDPVHLSLDAKEAEQLFYSISVDNTIVELKVEGEKKPYETLIREIQVHPLRQTLTHVDFLRIQEGVTVEVNVPVHLIGIPEGVKNSGGVLEQIIHDLAVRCIPSKIPQSIDIDVAHLEAQRVFAHLRHRVRRGCRGHHRAEAYDLLRGDSEGHRGAGRGRGEELLEGEEA